MLTRISLTFALTVFAVGCATSQGTDDRDAELISDKNEPKHRKAIKEFADSAAQGDIKGMMKDIGSVTLEVNNKDKLEDYLRNKIAPSFQDYKGVTENSQSLKVAGPGGNVGLQYYEFIDSGNGRRQPFVITLFPEDGALAVTSIEVGTCLPGYHVRCP